MNQIQLSSDHPALSLQYFEDAQKGIHTFFEQNISQIAWQILSRSAMQLYNFCSMTRWQNRICTHLPGMASPLFRLVLPTAVFAIDCLIFYLSNPKQNTAEPLVNFSLVNNAEDLLGSLTAGISLSSQKIPDHHFNLLSQTRLFGSLLVFSFAAFFNKQYRLNSEKITRLFFESIIQEDVELTKKLLLHPNLNLRARDKYFKVTPLHIAAMYGEPFISKLCQKYISPHNHQDVYMATPLHYAVMKQRNDSIIVLSKTDGNINAKNINEDTPLHFAAFGNCLDCIKALAENKQLSWNLVNGKKMTALEIAASEKHLKIVEYLLKINSIRSKPSSLIIDAIAKGSLELIKIYQKDARFAFSAILNSKSKETFLHYATRLGQLKIASYLLTIPTIDLFAKNSDGQTAYDVALKYKHIEFAKEILEKLLLLQNKNAPIYQIPPRPTTQQEAGISFLNIVDKTLDCIASDEPCYHLLDQVTVASHHLIDHLSLKDSKISGPSSSSVEIPNKKTNSDNI